MSRSAAPRLFDRAALPAFVIATLALAASGVGFRAAVRHLNVYLRKEPVPLRQHLATIPRTLDPWVAVGDDEILDDAQGEALGTSKYLNRLYRNTDDDAVLQLHVAYYTGMIDAVPHIPDRCFVAGGWDQQSAPTSCPLEIPFAESRVDPEHRNVQTDEPYRLLKVRHPVTGKRTEVRLPIGEPEIRILEFTRDGAEDERLWGGYFFIANHRLTASPAVIRSLAFRPSERYAYYCKVQVAARLDRDEPKEVFLRQSRDLLERVVPHLMRCLPDWMEIESRDWAADTAAEPVAQQG